jgi:peroxiredoxin
MRVWTAASAALIVCGVSQGGLHGQEPAQKQGAPETRPQAPGPADQPLKIGDQAPDFELTSSAGKKIKLSDYKDKVVVLQWVNKECPFCLKAAPRMKETCERYAPHGVVWLGIDSTRGRKPDACNEYIEEAKLPFPILLDPEGRTGRAFGAKTTPHIFIINKGKLAYAGAPDDGKDQKRSYVAEALDAILAGKDVPVSKTRPYGCPVQYEKH